MSAPWALQNEIWDVFDGFSRYYDAFTAHHDYELWMDRLEALAVAHGLVGRRLLDVACGTGKSLEPMLTRGYEATGCDVSPRMLARARPKLGPAVPLVEADMRALPELGRFDLVTCIDEPLNYLLDPADLSAAFASAAHCLAPDGVYLFDLNTLHTYRGVCAEDGCHEHDGWLFVWRGLTSPTLEPGGLAEFAIEAFEPRDGDCWRRHTSPHAQRHHPPELVVELLAEAGLTTLAIYGQDRSARMEPVLDESRHTKAIFLATPER
jgi:predicted TPR repeat methyltransferase